MYSVQPATQILGQTDYRACDSPPPMDLHSLRLFRPPWWHYRLHQVELASGCLGRRAAPQVRDASLPAPRAPLTRALCSGTVQMSPRSWGTHNTHIHFTLEDPICKARGKKLFVSIKRSIIMITTVQDLIESWSSCIQSTIHFMVK
jgi:hypothetical protein